MAATLYFLHMRDIVDARDVISGMRDYQIVLQKRGVENRDMDNNTRDIEENENEKRKEKETIKIDKMTPSWLTIPLSLITPLLFWSVMFTVSMATSWTRARIRLQTRCILLSSFCSSVFRVFFCMS